ncbi:sphingomyelin phosphodiesterase 5 isoform X1 [Conger conger]|uniref:sphingomyelin phosphodiesterase 5 isoform X1 n=1 Tax=Conger conger TaxID=82655 RepID=UPI002A59AFA7|nr:sphingomyelin phosphodiesterase 5 isoform X1 [Conger conger]XP_061095894.1 sphingomyelin phosphodiesterase 5 isoform X1 [Conger conger]XP_061095903.1 sphingomyelin phosphodiesterase 5 isoform X1 [Conger conger]
MTLRESPFSNGCAEGLHAVGWALILPCFWFLEKILAVCNSTSLERAQRAEQECYLNPLRVFFGAILFFTLFLLTAPLALLGFLLWAPLQAARRPFSYHQEAAVPQEEQPVGSSKVTFGFVTGNLCLLPDGLARFNNLGHTQRRATAIGKLIAHGVSRPRIRIFVDSPSSCGTLSPSSSLLPQPTPSYGATGQQDQSPPEDRADQAGRAPRTQGDVAIDLQGEDPEPSAPPASAANFNQNSNQQSRRGHRHPPRELGALGSGDDVPWEVSALFPANTDMVCLEEVFDKRAAQKLTAALGPLFGHVLYDVGVYACQVPGCCAGFKFFNSGLFLASRYPVLEAQYHCFPNSKGEDALAAKGLLAVKVLIGQNQEQNVVGYFSCTHLHAPEGEGAIRCIQLDMVTKWIAEFQAQTKQSNETVVFDVLCGDFNFDNCSPDDVLEQKHGLFEDYRDPCRAGPGKEKQWVIGTLLNQPTLYDDEVKTPDNLQETLEREELRKCYIAQPIPLAGCPLVYPEPGQPWVGRRIDYILYRESTLHKQCHTEVEEFTFVTQLAGLTDHIPVGLRLTVTLDSDGADP